ncbi:hypothetical protein T492DRAFT_99831 [Pavlovales sp. CCMP2436]|nr:hypothetical protein T492DRAFT_99831 [Pavlovales sp. CCMP2436]
MDIDGGGGGGGGGGSGGGGGGGGSGGGGGGGLPLRSMLRDGKFALPPSSGDLHLRSRRQSLSSAGEGGAEADLRLELRRDSLSPSEGVNEGAEGQGGVERVSGLQPPSCRPSLSPTGGGGAGLAGSLSLLQRPATRQSPGEAGAGAGVLSGVSAGVLSGVGDGGLDDTALRESGGADGLSGGGGLGGSGNPAAAAAGNPAENPGGFGNPTVEFGSIEVITHRMGLGTAVPRDGLPVGLTGPPLSRRVLGVDEFERERIPRRYPRYVTTGAISPIERAQILQRALAPAQLRELEAETDTLRRYFKFSVESFILSPLPWLAEFLGSAKHLQRRRKDAPQAVLRAV